MAPPKVEDKKPVTAAEASPAPPAAQDDTELILLRARVAEVEDELATTQKRLSEAEQSNAFLRNSLTDQRSQFDASYRNQGLELQGYKDALELAEAARDTAQIAMRAAQKAPAAPPAPAPTLAGRVPPAGPPAPRSGAAVPVPTGKRYRVVKGAKIASGGGTTNVNPGKIVTEAIHGVQYIQTLQAHGATLEEIQ